VVEHPGVAEQDSAIGRGQRPQDADVVGAAEIVEDHLVAGGPVEPVDIDRARAFDAACARRGDAVGNRVAVVNLELLSRDGGEEQLERVVASAGRGVAADGEHVGAVCREDHVTVADDRVDQFGAVGGGEGPPDRPGVTGEVVEDHLVSRCRLEAVAVDRARGFEAAGASRGHAVADGVAEADPEFLRWFDGEHGERVGAGAVDVEP
jgi:hypothetical protein